MSPPRDGSRMSRISGAQPELLEAEGGAGRNHLPRGDQGQAKSAACRMGQDSRYGLQRRPHLPRAGAVGQGLPEEVDLHRIETMC